ncbi:hypothetical protein GDO86_001433 [Hymenochirus boettgeri]|uniref:Cationic amino acid transporter C-terminal domain-containing protein n=1 Tax=Hymenochirus boettgeri TaxID=247094 RepID=A0A8T2KH47_9PIPI|nr:hypothetical protein GDO86_001433 [Hymenochirus boettgeri]
MSIGTLLAYSLVATCVLVLRYQPEQPNLAYQMAGTTDDFNESVSTTDSQGTFLDEDKFNLQSLLFPKNAEPTRLSGYIVNVSSAGVGLVIITFCCLVVFGKDLILEGNALVILPLAVSIFFCLLFTVIIWRQPESKTKLSFKVPLLPVIPIVSILVNVFLMMQLDEGTWIRFSVWMVLGFIIYFGYGVWHSSESASSGAESGTVNYNRPNVVLNNKNEKRAFLEEQTTSDSVATWEPTAE